MHKFVFPYGWRRRSGWWSMPICENWKENSLEILSSWEVTKWRSPAIRTSVNTIAPTFGFVIILKKIHVKQRICIDNSQCYPISFKQQWVEFENNLYYGTILRIYSVYRVHKYSNSVFNMKFSIKKPLKTCLWTSLWAIRVEKLILRTKKGYRMKVSVPHFRWRRKEEKKRTNRLSKKTKKPL